MCCLTCVAIVRRRCIVNIVYSYNKEYIFEVSGKLAYFTRTEIKVEQVSYKVIIPSAVRAMFEAIYWKAQIRWQVLRINVLKPITFTHICRCEVASMANAKKNHIITDNHR